MLESEATSKPSARPPTKPSSTKAAVARAKWKRNADEAVAGSPRGQPGARDSSTVSFMKELRKT